MKYRKETEGGMLREMSANAHSELFKSGKYDVVKMYWFMQKTSTVLAENCVYNVKTNIFELATFAVFIFLSGIAVGITIGEMFQ